MLQLFAGLPTNAYQPSLPFQITGERIVIDMAATDTGAGLVNWFLEFTSDDPNSAATQWFREVAEEDVGNGVTHMPAVERDYITINGVVRFTAQFVRSHQYARVQFKATAGVTALVITTPFGLVARSVS